MDEKTKKILEAFELREKGLSLREIEKKTGINYKHLSVIFNYFNLNDVYKFKLKNMATKQIKITEEENKELKEKLKKLEEILNRIEKEKKDLAINLHTSKYLIKVIKPTTFALIFSIALFGGMLGGIYMSGTISAFLNKVTNLKKKETKLLEEEQNYRQKIYNQINKQIYDKYQMAIEFQNYLKINNIKLKKNADSFIFEIDKKNKYLNVSTNYDIVGESKVFTAKKVEFQAIKQQEVK